jgi:hypothetical protein
MAQSIPQAPRCDRIEWLPTEASGRRYARLHGPPGLEVPTAVFMQFPRGAQTAEIERVARATELLGQAGLPVPEIYESRPESGWILQEDLGDLTFAAAREQGRNIAGAYSEAVALLSHIETLQLETSPRPPLDERRLMTELLQFVTLGLKLPEGPGASLKEDLNRIVQSCCQVPVALCHRDYHSRNLMLHEDRVRVIDHQDAMPGPANYDRVSLAYDPYVELPDEIRDRIAGTSNSVGEVALQRLAKAIGTFADKGATWSAFIAPAARQARRLIAKHDIKVPVLDLAFATLSTSRRTSAANPTSDKTGNARPQGSATPPAASDAAQDL